MPTVKEFREMALALPNVVEEPHFERTSFRVNKKIFATMDEASAQVCLMLTVEDQSVFCLHQNAAIYPVPNKWGQKGATYVELNIVHPNVLADALNVAYQSKKGKK